LAHPNIVALHAAHDKGDRPFIALEFIPGTDLEALVQQFGPLSPGRAAAFLHQAALGLEHARQRNLIHRDIKPANLIPVCDPDTQTFCVKVLDWGLADVRPRAAEGSPLGPRDMVGTADYMAPEQATDPQSTDIRSDIYSLGCTAYFLLTGQPPFAGCSLAEKLVRHQMKEPTPLVKLRQDIPAGFGDVIRKMMAKKPEDRYQTPAAVAEALAPFATTDADEAEGLRPERRRSERYACDFPIHFKLPLNTGDAPMQGRAVDISQGGLRFRADRQHKPGTILSLTMLPHAGEPARTILARVIHVREAAAGTWEMGCAFARAIGEEEVRGLQGG
jgi:serine/threonine protein kinase